MGYMQYADQQPFHIVKRDHDDGYDLMGPNRNSWRWSRNYGELMDYAAKFNMVYELGYFHGLHTKEGGNE
ncbi:MAG: hypothetical protein IPL32_19385 [Chloracidobacterium sp.]|nr:hypothetical protein [Chloracidobacterium sp.]